MSRTVRGCQDSPRLQLSATGPAEVTAGMIAVSGDIEVMNPDHIICHLDQSATLTMELTAYVRTYFFPWARLNTYNRRRYGV